jgi:adenylate kinase
METLGLTQVASGDLFREHLKNNTELGKIAKIYLDRGELVPDELTIQMVVERLSRPDCQRGVILDGFPRTVAQAHSLDEALQVQGRRVNIAISIQVPTEVIVERLSGRWICPVDNRVYHEVYNPPQQSGICDVDGAKLYQRSDDQPDTVRKRIKVYQEKTRPLIEYYDEKNILVKVDGNQLIDQVNTLIEDALAERVSL